MISSPTFMVWVTQRPIGGNMVSFSILSLASVAQLVSWLTSSTSYSNCWITPLSLNAPAVCLVTGSDASDSGNPCPQSLHQQWLSSAKLQDGSLAWTADLAWYSGLLSAKKISIKHQCPAMASLSFVWLEMPREASSSGILATEEPSPKNCFWPCLH